MGYDASRRRTFSRSKGHNLSQWSTVLITLAVSVFCWAFAYNYSVGFPPKTQNGATPLWIYLCSLPANKYYSYIVGAFILVCNSLLLQRFNYHTVIIRQSTKLPFLMFVLLCSANLVFIPFTASSVALLLFIPAVFQIFKSEQSITTGDAFNAAFYIGLGSLLWAPLLLYIPFFWYGMYKFKMLNVKSFAATLVGLLTILLFVLAWCVWKHDLAALSVPAATLTTLSTSPFSEMGSDSQFINLISIFAMMIVAFIYTRFQEYESSLRTSQTLSYLLQFAIFTFALIFLYGKRHFGDFLYFFYMPAAMIFAYLFSDRRGMFAFLVYYLFVAFIFMLAFRQIWLM